MDFWRFTKRQLRYVSRFRQRRGRGGAEFCVSRSIRSLLVHMLCHVYFFSYSYSMSDLINHENVIVQTGLTLKTFGS